MKNEIISNFKENPKTKIAWWAIGLGIATLFYMPLLSIFTAVIHPMIDRAGTGGFGAAVGFYLMIALAILSVSAIVMGICALIKGERSWLLWLGFIPAFLNSALWIFIVIGEFIFPH